MKSRKVDTGIVFRSGSYFFTAYLGYDLNGKQIRKTTTWKAPEDITSQKKADKLAIESYIEFKKKCSGMGSLKENMKFKDLCEEYLKVYATTELKPITAYNYEAGIRNHLLPYFGNKKLKDITTGMLSDYFVLHTPTNKHEGQEGNTLISSTLRKIYTICQSVMQYAVNQQYLKDNPARNVHLPKSTDSDPEEVRKFLTEDELKRFMKEFEGYSQFNTIVKILLYTGMRSGECLGLQWEDIDFENRIIHIRHTLSDTGGKHFLTTPKSKHSKRYIGMNDTVAELLQEHRKNQLKLMQIIKPFPHPEMVFTSELGNYKDRSALNTSFRNHLKNTEFDRLTLHSLRHCNATLLIASGCDLKIVSEHLGHSDISVTANIYADVLDSTKRKTAEILQFKLG